MAVHEGGGGMRASSRGWVEELRRRMSRVSQRGKNALRFAFRRNGDASNMSRTDIRIGIPESASYRPEAHVFPFPCRVGSGFLFFPVRNWISSPNPLATPTCNTRTCVSKGLSDLISIKGDIFCEGIIARDKVASLPKDAEYISMYEAFLSELPSRRSARVCV